MSPRPGSVSFVVVTNSAARGVVVHDLLAESGYAYRQPEHFALPLRAIGAQLVIDLHPNDRGPKGTFSGAICHNGNLYCPATPKALFGLSPLARGASEEEVAAPDEQSAELSRYKLGRLTTDDDGYHRVGCPAVLGKCRCPLRPASMARPQHLPEILEPPQLPPVCSTKQGLTVPPGGQREDRVEARLSLGRLALLLRAPKRCGAIELTPEGPGGDQPRRARLAQAHGPHPARPVRRLRLRGRELRARRRLRDPRARGGSPQQPTAAETAKASPPDPCRPRQGDRRPTAVVTPMLGAHLVRPGSAAPRNRARTRRTARRGAVRRVSHPNVKMGEVQT